MKVFYDISVLGVGRHNPLARTGVARVVENIAYGLAASKECDLSFCESLSFRILKDCLNYLESNPHFKSIPFVHSSFLTIFYDKLIELENMLDIHSRIAENTISSSEDKSLFRDMKESLESIISNFRNHPYSITSQSLAKADIFHATFYPIPMVAREVKSVRKFLTVYDLIPILYPQFFVTDYEIQRNTSTIDSLSPEDWVICISHDTKNELCNYLTNIDPAKVFVTHLAADSNMFYPCCEHQKITSTQKKYHIPEGPYVLGLSTLEPRKNLDHLIRCFADLVQQQNINDLSLVLVGNKGWNYGKILEEISNNYLLKKRIILTGRVADEDLAALYSGAIAFVYPSFCEGFGLPPLEAMQCGVPVITSNTSSLPEVVGNAAIMLDPTDTDGLSNSIFKIYNQPSLREIMSLKSLEQAKKFSWKRCTQETIGAYKLSLSS